jgi:hypothetical protein
MYLEAMQIHGREVTKPSQSFPTKIPLGVRFREYIDRQCMRPSATSVCGLELV